MMYCINNVNRIDGTAAAKAPEDVFKVAHRLGYKEIRFYEPRKYKNINKTRFFAFFVGAANWFRFLCTVENNASVLIQHPYENILIGNKVMDYCRKKKNIHFMALVHDLDSLRKNFGLTNKNTLDNHNNIADEVLLRKCEVIICHNDSMKRYLISRGFQEEKLISLGVFDYFHNCQLPEDRTFERSVVVAGNLNPGKCQYLYNLMNEKRDYKIHLFGPNYITRENLNNVEYHGCFPAEEVPGRLKGGFGLVWDGGELDSCSGDIGQYLRYNNPHKVSLFLASNMPVIIWKEAALASFIEENQVGITVNSLRELDDVLAQVTDSEYHKYVENTKKIGNQLRNGSYTQNALCKLQKLI